MSRQLPLPDNYAQILGEIKNRVLTAQYEALKAVNRELISLYWDIGRIISDRQKEGAWGKSVVERLADDLQAEFPGIAGFSARNIWNMRRLYPAYHENEKLQPLVAGIGWSHNLIILEKCKDDLQKEFYIRMARRNGWTKNVLAMKIEDQAYEKTLTNQTNFCRTLPEPITRRAKLAVRDDYTFDFLELQEEHEERELELAIIGRIERFLREMGDMFAFMDSLYKLEIEGGPVFSSTSCSTIAF